MSGVIFEGYVDHNQFCTESNYFIITYKGLKQHISTQRFVFNAASVTHALSLINTEEFVEITIKLTKSTL